MALNFGFMDGSKDKSKAVFLWMMMMQQSMLDISRRRRSTYGRVNEGLGGGTGGKKIRSDAGEGNSLIWRHV